jgi:hypothetical protein
MFVKIESMTNEISLLGKTVNYYFLPGKPLIVSHGEFSITNNTDSSKDILIESCWFLKNSQKEILHLFHIYHENTLLSNPFRVKGKTDFAFRITFPFQMIETGSKKYALLIQGKYNNKIIKAESEISVFEERAL